jgi:Fic family protein
MSDTPRHSKAADVELVSDPIEKAKREAANALEQTAQLQALIASHVVDGRQFKLRPSTIMTLQRTAIAGLSSYAGIYRPADIEIEYSKHVPPKAHLVPELVEDMCEYVNDHWNDRLPVHLAAYVLWRLNWIHPFVDGNGRTARAIAYLVLSVKVGFVLPGSNTIPDQIIGRRKAYYDALEAADEKWKRDKIDLSEVEQMLATMLAGQLLSVAELASGPTTKA